MIHNGVTNISFWSAEDKTLYDNLQQYYKYELNLEYSLI